MIDLNSEYEMKLKIINACFMCERFYETDFKGFLLQLKDTPIENLENIFTNRLSKLIPTAQKIIETSNNEVIEDDKETKKPKKKTTTKKKK